MALPIGGGLLCFAQMNLVLSLQSEVKRIAWAIQVHTANLVRRGGILEAKAPEYINSSFRQAIATALFSEKVVRSRHADAGGCGWRSQFYFLS